MSSLYSGLLRDFANGQALSAAIVANDAGAFSHLARILLRRGGPLSLSSNVSGTAGAGETLSETLVVFRRQVKFRKALIEIRHNSIIVSHTDLTLYLDQLVMLVAEIMKNEQGAGQPSEAGLRLINGKGYRQVLRLKPAIIHSLAGFGCRNEDEREEIFNESLVVLWQKILRGQIGLILRGKEDQPDKYQVYHRYFFQSSRLSTFLTGIAKHIFLNHLKHEKRQPEPVTEFTDNDLADPGTAPSESPLFFMFLYYRAFVETRKLRVVISLLQYDCGLEESEVRQITGLSNARFHSCRLRQHFREWYDENRGKIHLFYDKATPYLSERGTKLEKLNRKILHIGQSRRERYLPFVPEFFLEEFRTPGEFQRHHPVFRYLFWLVSAGRASSLAGLPDERSLRQMMSLYREGLFHLPVHHALIYLLFYGTEEPENLIVRLLDSMSRELAGEGTPGDGDHSLAILLLKEHPSGKAELSDRLLDINRKLFTYFENQPDFLNLIRTYESDPPII